VVREASLPRGANIESAPRVQGLRSRAREEEGASAMKSPEAMGYWAAGYVWGVLTMLVLSFVFYMHGGSPCGP
jgi:hypothetical protein